MGHVLHLRAEEIGGLSNLIAHSYVADKLSLIPDMSNPDKWEPIYLDLTCRELMIVYLQHSYVQ
jgi:hypothetical protein